VGEPTLKLYSLQSCFNTRSGLQRRRPPPSDGGTSAMTRWNSYPVTLGTARTAVGAGAAGACGTTLGAVVVGAVVGGAVVGGLGTEARKSGRLGKCTRRAARGVARSTYLKTEGPRLSTGALP
jgi:hypothetical protein